MSLVLLRFQLLAHEWCDGVAGVQKLQWSGKLQSRGATSGHGSLSGVIVSAGFNKCNRKGGKEKGKSFSSHKDNR